MFAGMRCLLRVTVGPRLFLTGLASIPCTSSIHPSLSMLLSMLY